MKKKSDSEKERVDAEVKFWFWFVVVCVLAALGINLHEARENKLFDNLNMDMFHKEILEDPSKLSIPPPLEGATDLGTTFDLAASFVINNFSKFNDYVYIKNTDVLLI